MTQALVQVRFAGAVLIGKFHKGAPYVAMRPVVEGMGLDWSSQHQKISTDEVLGPTVVEIAMVAEDGKERRMLCLPGEMLQGWLFTINPKKVRPELRARIIQYKRECYRVLNEAFQAGEASASGRLEAVQAKRVASTVMCRILHDTLVAIGKDPKGYDYATEHRLVNHCITGVFGAISEDALTVEQLKLQEELRMQNAVWIGQGLPYQTRKPLLESHAAAWTSRQSLPKPARQRRALTQEAA